MKMFVIQQKKIEEVHASDFRSKVGDVKADEAAKLVSPHVATVEQAMHVIYSILNWFRSLLEKSINRYQFQSVDLVLACLRCFDDHVGACALEICAQMCLEPFTHRDVLAYDVDSIFMHSPGATIEPLMDIVAASRQEQFTSVLRSGRDRGTKAAGGTTIITTILTMRKTRKGIVILKRLIALVRWYIWMST